MSATKVSADFDMIALQFSVDTTEYQSDIGTTGNQMDRQISIRLKWTLDTRNCFRIWATHGICLGSTKRLFENKKLIA
jgi:hypothetical protein